ncbi:hypothetical protein [Actinoplanes sp. GCM10030250]|uniref:hypothetical protein n=1 Tax=Actinoplanes sp. GCM10030250 TaxID=3273376 RepID=UPI003608CB8A
MTSAEEAGQHIDRLLTQLRDSTDPNAAPAAEELVRHLVQLYGDGLTRIAAMLGPDRLTELSADPLVASLLLVHDLHPVPVADRVRQALAGTGAELLGISESGVVRLRVTASRCGAAGQIETAVRRAAPEVSGVDLATRPPLLQIKPRPVMHGDS